MNLNQLITQIYHLDAELKQEANKAVNQLLTMRNWLIGYYIVEYEQQGEDRAQYGTELLKRVAERLDTKGLSETNLKLCRQFFVEFPRLDNLIAKKLSINKLLISQSPTDLFSTLPTITKRKAQQPKHSSQEGLWSDELSARVVESLSFTHITLLLRLNDPLQRAFYAVEAIKGTWSVKELKRQVSTLLFERSGLSQQPKLLLRQINEEKPVLFSKRFVKDLYTFEFLGLTSLKYKKRMTILRSAFY